MAKDGKAGRHLRRLVTAEALLAVVILFAVGLLTALEPGRQVASRQNLGREQDLVFSETMEGLDIELAIIPGQVGLNQITGPCAIRMASPSPMLPMSRCDRSS